MGVGHPSIPKKGWLDQTGLGLLADRRRNASKRKPCAPERYLPYRVPNLGDSARAEDVAQEVYLQAWKSFHRFEPGQLRAAFQDPVSTA